MGKVKTSWVKGQSGNPKGRPKKEQSFKGLMDKHLDKELFVIDLLKHAQKTKDITLMKFIWERNDGRLPEKINLESNTFSDWVKSLK